MDHKEELIGGRAGKIHKIDGSVVRPANIWTHHVHDFLNFLHQQGAVFVPKPLGVNEQNEEILSFMPGEVFNYPLPEKLLSDSMLISAAHLLSRFHQYSEKYVSKLTNTEQWMLPCTFPIEVMCHGDFAPYNVTVQNDEAAGIIDFDTLHPGPKMWDIAYGIYRWVPFNNPENPDSNGSTLTEKIRKTKLFLDTYGINDESKKSFVEVLIKRLESLIEFMSKEASAGNEDFQSNIEDGHLQLYLDDIKYLKNNEEEIINDLLSS
ncbi:aminoglycoside phosphotransferase family protein [Paenibacillus jiagnxiensis]|uniref:aminoglycoside phosphotransferase family protein n=1 Tax=Paenibacillus jiagnxiensis TaxID=3228926 RepID=UPI0033B903F3